MKIQISFLTGDSYEKRRKENLKLIVREYCVIVFLTISYLKINSL